MSAAVEKYHRWSKGQLPAAFTPYRTAAVWRGNRFSNEKIKRIGYHELVSTREGMQTDVRGDEGAEDTGKAHALRERG